MGENPDGKQGAGDLKGGGAGDEGRMTEVGESESVNVLTWTGVIVKGASNEFPIYIRIKGADADFKPRVYIGNTVCKVAPANPTCTKDEAFVLTAIVPVTELDKGRQAIRIKNDKGNGAKPTNVYMILNDPGATHSFAPTHPAGGLELPVSVVDLVDVTYPADEDEPKSRKCNEMRGNTLAAIGIAEDYHEAPQSIEQGHQVAVLVTKSHSSDFCSVFVFGCKNGKARLDRYETAEANLEHRKKWDFIDTCELGAIAVEASGEATLVTVADQVQFIFEPRTAKQAYSANLRVGNIPFCAITCVGDSWIQWFSKQWVPAVAIGDPEEGGLIERFAAPTISSLTKRQRGIGKYVPHSQRPGWKEPQIAPPTPAVMRHQSPSKATGGSNAYSFTPYSPPPRPSPGPIGPRPHLDNGGGVRKCITTSAAPELAMYNRGEMVESKFPKRVPNLNMSPDVAIALKPSRSDLR